MLNWQHRLWMTIREFLKHRQNMTKTLNLAEFEKHEAKIWDSRNFLTATTTFHFKYTHKLSVGISRLQSLTSVLRVRLTNYKTFHVDTFNNCDFILIQVTQKRSWRSFKNVLSLSKAAITIYAFKLLLHTKVLMCVFEAKIYFSIFVFHMVQQNIWFVSAYICALTILYSIPNPFTSTYLTVIFFFTCTYSNHNRCPHS